MPLSPNPFRWRPNADGSLDGHNPNGDKGPAGTALAWGDLSAFIAAIQQTIVSSNQSVNARTALTGTSAATAALSWITVSGSDVTTTGFTVSGDNVLISSATPGSGFAKLRATDGSGSVDSAAISWSRVAAPSDTLGPTDPTGLLGTPGSGSITWTWDPAMDPHDGTTAGAGVKNYDLELNGSITIVSGLPGVTTAPTATNIGNISTPGAPTAVQSGRNWTLTAAGVGADGTSDEILFLNWQLSGDCTVIAKIASLTGAGANAGEGGVMIREDLTAGGKYVSAYQFLVSSQQGTQMKWRPTTSGAQSHSGSVLGTNTPRWLKLNRAGNVFTFSLSTDGLAWTAQSNITVAMNATVYIGAFVSSLTAGTNLAVLFNDINVGSNPQVSYTQTTSTATTARIRCRDLQTPTPNVGVYSVTTPSVTPGIVVGPPPMNWNPGFYMGTRNPTYADDRKLANQQVEQALVLSSGSKVLGWKGLYFPASFMNGSSFDFTKIIRDLNALRTMATPKRLMIMMFPELYGGKSYTDLLPSAFYTNAAYGNATTDGTTILSGAHGFWTIQSNTGLALAFWRPAVMDWVISLMQAMATTVNPQTGVMLKDEPLIEQIAFSETSLGVNTSDTTFSIPNQMAQYKRLIDAMRTYWPKVMFMVNNNYGGKADCQDLTNYIYAKGAGQGGPDTFVTGQHTPAPTYGQLAAIGVGQTSDTFFNGPDLRGKIAMVSDTQAPELVSGRYTTYTPMTTFVQVNTVLQQSHMVVSCVSPSATDDPNPAYPATGVNTGANAGNWHSWMQVINGQTLTHTSKPTGIP